jgi:di/tricarboxylate transporter
MSVDAWLTLGITVAAVALLVSERISAAVVIFGSVTLLMLLRVIEPEQALIGFSNPAPMTVAALYVLAAAAESTGALDLVSSRILRNIPSGKAGDRKALMRILLPTAASSALLNNTPIVAMVAPGILSWARRTGRSASRFLMPVCFAATVGGLATLIGTSTNIVVSGLMENSGQRPLAMFELGAVGAPIALISILVLAFLAFRLLPDRQAPSDLASADVREFTVEMTITDDSPLVSRTVTEGNLRSLEGVFLVEIERANRRMSPVAPDQVLASGDRLTFAGNVGRVLDLQRIPGLTSAEEAHFGVNGSSPRRMYEAVVGEGSPLVGATLKEVGFRSHYGAAVLAIHRSGERLPAKLGDVRMRVGDVLLVLAGPGFRRLWGGRRDFLVVAPLNGDAPPRTDKAPIVGVVLAALLVTVTTGVLDILEASLAAAFALVGMKVVSVGDVRRAIDVNIIIVIAASFGLGEAVMSSGLAAEIAGLVVEPLGSFGDIGLLLGVLVASIALTELITNNAAAVLMFPIAMATAAQAGLNPRPFAIAVAIGASAGFLSPFGYQTNMMVYGMGGYRFGDFARLGWPLSVISIALSLVIIPLVWSLR